MVGLQRRSLHPNQKENRLSKQGGITTHIHLQGALQSWGDQRGTWDMEIYSKVLHVARYTTH